MRESRCCDARFVPSTDACSRRIRMAAATVVTVSRRTVPSPRPWCSSATSKATSAVHGATRTKRAMPAGRPSTVASQATWSWPSTSVSAPHMAGVSLSTPVRNRSVRDVSERPSNTACCGASSPGRSGRNRASPFFRHAVT